MSTKSAGFPWRGYAGLLIVSVVLGLFPAIALSLFNLGEPGAPNNLPALMASGGVLGWLWLAPTVLGGMAFLLGVVVLPFHLMIWHRRRSRRGASI